MPVELREEAGWKVLIIGLSGKLTREDYERFVPEVERLIGRQGKVRMLVKFHDFQGWSVGALWSDIKFDLKHFADVERLAFVGDKRWEAGMALFCRPLTRAKVRFFDRSKADEALDWIREGALQPV
jgi:hypothetical protein